MIETHYLQIIDSKTFVSWDVKGYFQHQGVFRKELPLVLFGEFLSKIQTTKIHIQDDQEYKILGVRTYGKGVFVNRIVKGKTLTMRTYQLADRDTLFWCKVDTKNGGFGIIQEEHIGGLGSSNMTFAKIDTSKINKDFLQLLFTSTKIYNYLDQFITGTTNRKYIKPDQLLEEIQIPLPSLEEQNKIVTAYQSKLQDALDAETQSIELEKKIETYLMEELGIELTEKEDGKKGLQFLNFDILNRWDVRFLLGSLPTIKSKFNIKVFSDIVINLNKGHRGESIRINSSIFPNEKFKYIGMENIEKETGILLEMIDVTGIEIQSQTVKIPKGYLIFGKLRPYLNKYWVNYTDYDNIICSSEFLVFDVNKDINKEFFKYCLSSSFIQHQISDKTSGARMPRINEDIFMNLQFPVPPLGIQEYIVARITLLKDEIKRLKTLASTLRDHAKAEFEGEIFS